MNTTKRNEIHFWTINELFSEYFSNGESDFRLVSILIADGDAVLVAIAAGGAESMNKLEFKRRHVL